MAITGTVGPCGANAPFDVKLVQILLNASSGKLGLAEELAEDGHFGARTKSAMERLFRACPDPAAPLLVPGSPMLQWLRRNLPEGCSRSVLSGIMLGSRSLVELYQPMLAEAMARHAIDTPLRMAHFLAQIGHESGGLRYCEELGSGAAYEDRADLGNTEPGDGPRFKGRGLIQLTGRVNYQAFGKALGQTFLDDATSRRLAEPALAVAAACWFWSRHRLNRLADQDDIVAITRTINGGVNGLAGRKAYLLRARFLFGC